MDINIYICKFSVNFHISIWNIIVYKVWSNSLYIKNILSNWFIVLQLAISLTLYWVNSIYGWSNLEVSLLRYPIICLFSAFNSILLIFSLLIGFLVTYDMIYWLETSLIFHSFVARIQTVRCLISYLVWIFVNGLKIRSNSIHYDTIAYAIQNHLIHDPANCAQDHI